MINITGRLHFPEHEDDCMEAYPLRADTWTQGHMHGVWTTKYNNIVV